MNSDRTFRGFPDQAFRFLRQLKANNNKMWFEQHRQDYQIFLLEPMKKIVQNLSDFMLTIDPYFDVRPAINRTISKIHRDTRFSNDKSPYKTSMWITFKRPVKNWKDAPAYFFEMSSEAYRFGMGHYRASPNTMELLRKAIDDDPKKFVQTIAFYSKQSIFTIEGEQYVKIFDKSKPEQIQNWYQRRNLYLVCNRSIDQHLFSDQLIDTLIEGFRMLAPLYNYFWEIKDKYRNQLDNRR